MARQVRFADAYIGIDELEGGRAISGAVRVSRTVGRKRNNQLDKDKTDIILQKLAILTLMLAVDTFKFLRTVTSVAPFKKNTQTIVQTRSFLTGI